MIITRKIGSLLRGKATPFQLYAASLLGCLLGFLPGFEQAPGLILLWGFLLLILNTSLFLAGAVTLLAKLVFLLTMPGLFWIGRLLLEGPTQGIFKALINAPVTAYSGLDYYVVAGGQLVALVVGLALGTVLTRMLYSYRRKMAELSESSERLAKYSSKGWVKAMKFLFLGGSRGKASYQDLMATKVGNPIRIWGATLVVICVVVISLAFNWLAGPMMTALAKSNLETVNGATVDLEDVNLQLQESKMEIVGLAMADPQDLNTNIFESAHIVADVSAADLLRKRFSIDHLAIENAASGSARAERGVQIGPEPEAKPKIELPDFADLEGVLKDSEVWKERLAQAKRWLERLTAGDEPKKGATWKEDLNSRIQAVGYAHVKADFLTEGSPTFWIRRLEALGVDTPYFDGAQIDIVGTNLSTHPNLVDEPATLTMDSDNDRFEAQFSLGGASGTGDNLVQVRVSDYPVDPFASNLESSGEPPLEGGTMDIDLSGSFGALENDLVAQVAFDGTTARIAGEPLNLDGVTLPIMIRGPLDHPVVKLESKALERVLLSAGKKRLLDEAAKELGIENKEGSEPKDLLRGIFKKKLEEE